jgi:hypothetical protein
MDAAVWIFIATFSIRCETITRLSRLRSSQALQSSSADFEHLGNHLSRIVSEFHRLRQGETICDAA